MQAYSDSGLDGIAGTSDDTVTAPPLDFAVDDGETRLSPCDGGKCSISGATSTWPRIDNTTDYLASVWGGGLRISLNSAAKEGPKLAYEGSLRGFRVNITGDLNGQVLRVGHTQTANDQCAPFIEMTATGEYEVLLTEPTCPSWTCDPNCISPTVHPYELQVQVVGGDVRGNYELCIESVTPIL